MSGYQWAKNLSLGYRPTRRFKSSLNELQNYIIFVLTQIADLIISLHRY